MFLQKTGGSEQGREQVFTGGKPLSRWEKTQSAGFISGLKDEGNPYDCCFDLICMDSLIDEHSLLARSEQI